MIRFMRKFFILPVLVVSAVALNACTGPNPDAQDLSPLETNEGVPPTGQTETGSSIQPNQGNIMPEEAQKTMADFETITAKTVTLKTNKGDVVIELFTEKAPLTTTNFLNLIQEKFYDGIVFHRVEPNFVVQFGDPQTKTPGTENLWGTGGPGYTIADEFDPTLRHDSPGILSMANRGPDTGGSQLFITLDATPFLDDKHAVLGKVTSGMDIVNQLQVGDKILSASFE